MTSEGYKNVCEQIEYEQNKYNKLREDYDRKKKGINTVINALQEMKDQYEMGENYE